MPVDVKEVYHYLQNHPNDVAYRSQRCHTIVMRTNNDNSSHLTVSSSSSSSLTIMSEDKVIILAWSLEENRKRLLSQIYKERSNFNKLKRIQHETNSHSTHHPVEMERLLVNIQSLEKSLNDTQLQLEEYCNHISNIPDDTNQLYKKLTNLLSTSNFSNNNPTGDFTTLYSLRDTTTMQVTVTPSRNDHTYNNKDTEIKMDPLWCLGGCDYYSLDTTNRTTNNTFNTNNSVNTKWIVTGVGYSLQMAIQLYAISFLRQHPPINSTTTNSWEVVHLPNTHNHPTPPPRSHNIGCSCGMAQTNAKAIPSHILTLSSIHSNKTYTKRNVLPIFQIVPSNENVELFSICKSSTSDSRTIQLQMAYQIAHFHWSLLHLSTSSTKSTPTNTIPYIPIVLHDSEDTHHTTTTTDMSPSMLRIRILAKNLLHSTESSKLIVEGLLLAGFSTKNQSKKKDPTIYVELGYVTNYQEYISRQFHTKCVNNEYVHTIHGSFCNLTTTLSWMLQQNQRILTMSNQCTNNTTTSSDPTSSTNPTILRGCILNSCLLTFVVTTCSAWVTWKESISSLSTSATFETSKICPHKNHPTLLFLPFHRRLVRGKKDGKKQIVSIDSPSPIELYSIPNNCTEPSGDDSWDHVPLSLDSHIIYPPHTTVEEEQTQTLSVPINFQNITVENPFDFLPIYK